MLKKSLIALAMAATGAANAAATVTVTPSVVALEGHQMSALGNNVLNDSDLGGANNVVIAAGTAYIVNDLVYLTVSGATFDTTDIPTVAATTAGTGSINFVDFADANTARFRITTADWAAADSLAVSSFTLKTTGANTSSVIKFGAKAVSVNPLIGNYDVANPVNGFTFVNQIKNTVTPLDGEVSTANGRAQFTVNPNQDILRVSTTDAATAVDALSVTKLTHVITGNFSWVMDYDLTANGGDADGVMDAGEIAAAFTSAAAGAAVGGGDAVVYTLNSTLNQLTVTDTMAGGVDAGQDFKFNNVGYAASGSVIASPQTFEMTTTVTNGTQSFSLAPVSAGKFTLDGSTTNVAFLPYGANYAQSVTVTNRGSVEGAITVDVTANGVTHSQQLAAMSTAKSVTDISSEVKALVASKFGADFEGNVSLSIVTNSPDIEATALYFAKSDADRVLVQSK